MAEHRLVHPEADRFGGWTWDGPRDGEHYRTCSYCGSIHPADLADELVWQPEWADRKYGWPHKFYVDVPNRSPETIYVIGSTKSNGRVAWPSVNWVATADANEEQRAAIARNSGDRDVDDWLWDFGTRAVHHAKHYSIHLSDPAIDPAVKGAIERRSGIAFTFGDGRVSWGPAPADPE